MRFEMPVRSRRPPYRHSSLASLFLFLSLALSATAHPMDEWFVSLELRGPQEIAGVFRVPAEQADRAKTLPVQFTSSGRQLEMDWLASGVDEVGRVKLQVSGKSAEPITELTIELPQGLLDQDQSLVGFIKLGAPEPQTLLIAQGGSESFAVGQAALSLPSTSSFFKLGLSHILEGHDHLLFLFCLLLAGGTLKHFLVVITSFTLGHSITLAASVLGYISLPPNITETIIALSIVIAALANIPWLKRSEAGELDSTVKSRGLLAGGFGLIHGLGFAGILKQIGVEGRGMLSPLFGFNLGVEVGQLIVVLLFPPFLLLINRWEKRIPFLKACSYLAALVGFYWLIQRLGGW